MITAPDYISFLGDISKQWRKENNNEIAFEFGLDKSSLPSLIRLYREWEEVFNTISSEKTALDNKIKLLTREIKELKESDLVKLNENLRLEIQSKNSQIYDLYSDIEDLRENVEYLQDNQKPKTFLSALRGDN